MKRGAKNGGTIRHRSDGRWEARINLGRDPVTGKQKQMSVYGQTQKEVRQKLNELTIRRDNCSFKGNCELTVGEWMDNWVSSYLLNVKDSTKALYIQKIRLYIKPTLGNIKLSKLTHDKVQHYYGTLAERLSPKSVKDIHGVLHKAMEQAVLNDYIGKNPCTNCELPKVSKTEIHPLSDDQQRNLLKAIKGHVHEDLYTVALFTGMREGELLGLTWDCVDFDAGTVLINKQLKKDKEKGGRYYFDTPKNGCSRTITPAPFIMDVLHEHKQKQDIRAKELGDVWADTGLVFTNPLGNLLSYRTAYDCFKRIVANIGSPTTRLHDLRHTYAVNSIRAGDDVKTVQGNLGHSSVEFTLNVYGHYTEEMKTESAKKMDEFAKRFYCD